MKREKSIWYEHQPEEYWRSEYPEYSMYKFMKRMADKNPELDALWFEGKSVSFSQMISMIDSTYNALLSLGIKKGDVVSILLPNMPQAVYLFYALNKIGAIANMMHPLLSHNEIKSGVVDSKSVLLFTLDSLFDKVYSSDWKDRPKTVLVDIGDALPFLKRVIFPFVSKKTQIKESPSVLKWSSFLKTKKINSFSDQSDAGDDVATLMYSGGTTGKSKAVMLTNKNLNSLAIQAYETMGIYEIAGLKVLALFPIFHPAGLGICIHSMLCHGICVYLIPTFDFRKCARVIFKNKVELIFGVPTFYEALLRSKEIEKNSCDFFRLLGCAGDQLPDRLRKRMNQRMQKDGNPTTMTNGYGLTECGACCCVDPFFYKKPGSSGLIAPDTKAKIVHIGTKQELPIGEVGELCISGPTVMKGYYNNESETKQALRVHDDGRIWLHTGDAFLMDEEGYLYFKQRIDRMFIVSGYNVYPSQIEAVILKTGNVQHCCVVGVSERVSGKKVIAYVIPAPNVDKEMLRKQILSACKKNIPQYAYPSDIVFLNDFPKTKLGKIDYKKLEKEDY